MMGNYSNMMGGAYGGSMMFFGWITSILVLTLLVLAIVALWKYIKK